MSHMGSSRTFARGAARTISVLAAVMLASAIAAAAASAHSVEIVSQSGPPAGPLPAKVHYFTTIQEAVNATKGGDWVLIEPGVYHEEVKVDKEHSGIYIRGMDRNTVIIDGENK